MKLPSINPIETKAWKKLSQHFLDVKDLHMKDLFDKDHSRIDRMKINWNGFQLDFSKNRITDTTINLLLNLAEEVKLKEAVNLQFDGAHINETEDRAVLHTALRDLTNLHPEVKQSLRIMKRISNDIIRGTWKGYSGEKITDIVNIGIGGSDLGTKMVSDSLSYYKNHLKVHYVSNVDGDHVLETLEELDRKTTIFIIVSKTFTTQETLANANTIKDWFLKEASILDIEKHFLAISSNKNKAVNFGISEANILPMWNWVGGRFSLWSAVGLSICLSVGFKNFKDLLEGAHQMDRHFKTTPFSNNIPVILALLSIWYNNFFECETEAVIPYTQYLEKFVPYLQQVTMESNGKHIDRNGKMIHYQTGTVVWGDVGTNAQHAFFQLIHQGTKLVPVDFIGFRNSLHGNKEHHSLLMANFIAQPKALLQGTYKQKITNPHASFIGNKPSNTILIDKLNPRALGSLIAIYEHKIFVQGIVWNIFSYDQWGVELGKIFANEVLST